MAKVNPSTLRLPTSEEMVVTITSPNLDQDITLRLRSLSAVALVSCAERGHSLFVKHVSGYGDPEEEGYAAPIPLPPVAGRPCVASANTLTMACALEDAQVVGDESDRYTALDLIAFMQDTAIFNQIAAAFERVTKTKVKQSPNPQSSES